jgi:ferric hydroxamate transport system ATP-binding protein
VLGQVELQGRDVHVAYGRSVVVHGVDIELRGGEVMALIGPNGSGKSTLLRAFTRLHRPLSGSVTLADGTPVAELPARTLATRLTLLSQSRAAPGGVKVRELVEYGRYPYRGRWGNADPDGRAVVERAMAMTGVTELAERAVDTLSGGQAQRAWLASCLAQDTEVLLLDEPTSFLDLRYQVQLLDIVRDLADEHGIAVGIVLHDLDQAAAIADTVVLLVEGRIAASGTVEDVLRPAVLSEAYGIPVDVDRDPATGLLRSRAVARHHHRRKEAPQ